MQPRHRDREAARLAAGERLGEHRLAARAIEDLRLLRPLGERDEHRQRLALLGLRRRHVGHHRRHLVQLLARRAGDVLPGGDRGLGRLERGAHARRDAPVELEVLVETQQVSEVEPGRLRIVERGVAEAERLVDGDLLGARERLGERLLQLIDALRVVELFVGGEALFERIVEERFLVGRRLRGGRPSGRAGRRRQRGRAAGQA